MSAPLKLKLKCPSCNSAFEVERRELALIKHLPFCTERCKLLDLGKWANEEYKVAGAPLDTQTPQDQGPEE